MLNVQESITFWINLSPGSADQSDHPANIGSYADVNDGTKFDNSDLQSLLLYLKTGHGSVSSVPEPSTIVLGGIGLVAILLCTSRRRKAF
jgi:hypothetical protein